MKPFVALAAFVFTTLFCAQPAPAQQVTQDISYTQLGGGQKADFYLPSGQGPFPVIVYIHGGSWRSGNKDVYRKLATDLAAQGYAGFAIDYDLKPHSFPLSLQQARDAVSFLHAHADDYHLDRERILVAGDSAGGELAALLALVPQKDSPSTTDIPIAAAILFNGVYDLCSSAHVIERYLGDNANSVCTAASPLKQVHPDAPPFFIGHGTADTTVPFSEAQAFTDALRTQHVFVASYVAAGGPHSYWKQSKYYAANLTAVEHFLKNLNVAAKGATGTLGVSPQ